MPPPNQDIPPPASPSGPFNLLRPLLLLFYSACYIVPTTLHLIVHGQLSALLSPARFKEHWFARFWAFFGPRSRDFADPDVLPLLRQNARGVCLDIGPGTGQWLSVFARADNSDITKILGVEPNPDMHAPLRESAVRAGLADVYEVIGYGAEELTTQAGIAPNSIDTIITVQSLCSIPTPERIIKELYPLLKPGGRWLVYEHVQTKYQGDFVALWQRESLSLFRPHPHPKKISETWDTCSSPPLP